MKKVKEKQNRHTNPKRQKKLMVVIALIKQENSYNNFIEYKEMRKNVNEK